MRLHGEIIPGFSEGIIDRTGAQTMLYLTCTMISSVNLAHYGVSRAKGWVSVDCGTKHIICHSFYFLTFYVANWHGDVKTTQIMPDNQLLQLCTARKAWSDSVFRSASISISVFMFVVTKY